MNPENMVHMANQIALNFASYPRKEAVAKVANHLESFWEPRMKRQLHEFVANGGGGLHELVFDAEKLMNFTAKLGDGDEDRVRRRPQAV